MRCSLNATQNIPYPKGFSVALANMHDVRRFFEIGDLKDFRAEWARLDVNDKRDLYAGIGDGSLTY
jgi:hypothetical protein